MTTQRTDKSLWVITYDRETGKLLKEVKVGAGDLVAKGPANLWAHRHNSATPSPIADEEHIWSFFGTGLLVCVDAESGAVRWQRDLVKDFGAYDITFGMGATPRLWGDYLFVTCLTKAPSYVVAFDKLTGEVVWKVDRELPAADDGPDAYSTPLVHPLEEGAQLIVAGSDHVDGYDLATGRQLWVSSGLKIDSPYGRVIASPTALGNVVLATSANPGGGGKGRVIALRIGTGDISQSNRLWEYASVTPDSSTPLLMDGKAYLLSDNGVATCLSLSDGKVVWRERLPQGPYHAALVGGDGKIYCLSISGTCSVLSADSGKTLGQNVLEGTFYATPAISDGTIYLRAYERLVAISGE